MIGAPGKSEAAKYQRSNIRRINAEAYLKKFLKMRMHVKASMARSPDNELVTAALTWTMGLTMSVYNVK